MTLLFTKRLYLRELCPADKPELARVLSDPVSMRFYPRPYNDAELDRWISWSIDNYSKYNHGLWAVIRREDGRFLGDCGITMQNIDGEILPEIGYHFIGEYCNRGYASEAAAVCRDYAFDYIHYPRVYSYTTKENIPSQRVAAKIGMKIYKRYESGGEDYVVSYMEAGDRTAWGSKK